MKETKAIELKLRLASKTEKRLREYVKKEFKTTLEQKLRDVLIEWIGKAISNNRENEKYC